MPLAVECPSCSSRVTAPDKLAGKTVKCPKCASAFVLPAPDPGFEVVGTDEPVPARPVRKPRPRVVGEEDEEDDRPRTRRGGKKAPTPQWMYPTIAGVCVFVAAGAGLWFAFGKSPKSSANSSKSGPKEWILFDPVDEPFSVLLPGSPNDPFVANDLGDRFVNATMRGWEVNLPEIEYKVLTIGFTGVLPEWATDDALLTRMVAQFTSRAERNPGVRTTTISMGQRTGRQ